MPELSSGHSVVPRREQLHDTDQGVSILQEHWKEPGFVQTELTLLSNRFD